MTAHNARTIRANLGYVRPEKQTVARRAEAGQPDLTHIVQIAERSDTGSGQVRGWPLNCDVLPLNIKGASRFLRKWPLATLDIEAPEALWPETKGQAASLARVRGHPLHSAAGHQADPGSGWAQVEV